MCKVLHVEWRCKHTQNIWEYCRDATAPSRTPSAELAKQPCEAFISKHGATPNGPTKDEYRNFCCKFVCCLEDQADTYRQVLDLESALGMSANESLPHIPSLFLSRQRKSLKELRKKFQALVKRHELRCEALYYGLGVVQESDAYRAPAEKLGSKKQRYYISNKRRSRDSSRRQSAGQLVEAKARSSEDVLNEAQEKRPETQGVGRQIN